MMVIAVQKWPPTKEWELGIGVSTVATVNISEVLLSSASYP